MSNAENILLQSGSSSWTTVALKNSLSNYTMIVVCAENAAGLILNPITIPVNLFKLMTSSSKFLTIRMMINSTIFHEINVYYINDNSVGILNTGNNKVSIYGIG